MEYEVVLERVYTIPFYPKLNSVPRTKRAPRAIRILREFVSRHMKSDDIIIEEAVNEYIWSRGIQKPPRKITVRVEKTDDEVVEVTLVTSSGAKADAKVEVPATVKSSESEIDEEDFEEEED